MLLTDLFGDGIFIRLLDFFLSNPSGAYLKKEIHRRVGISKVSLWRNWDELEEYDVVKKADLRGRDKWTLDQSSSVTKSLQLLRSSLEEDENGRDL